MNQFKYIRLIAISLITIVFLFLTSCFFAINPVLVNGENYIADLGFRPDLNGFSFENYGDEKEGIQNLTFREMEDLFGDVVCSTKNKAKCILTPPAKRWMKEMNEDMDGGHCEGMAALSLLLYSDPDLADEWDINTASELRLDNDKELQREIAYWFATQAVQSVVEQEIIDKTPVEILNFLEKKLTKDASTKQTYTIGIFNLESGKLEDGHSITPYAIVDKGNDEYGILVYDNNYPKQELELIINKKKNTWMYNGSPNPNEEQFLYTGNAKSKNLFLTPTAARLEPNPFDCDFCPQDSKKVDSNKITSTTQYNQIFTEGSADLLIENYNGGKIGTYRGEFFNNFPGAKFIPIKSDELLQNDSQPIYNIPVEKPFKITLDGNSLTKTELTDVVMIGPGYDVGIEDIQLEPNDKDTINFASNGQSLTYTSSSSEAPNIIFGIVTPSYDYEFELNSIEIDPYGTISAELDTDKGQLKIHIDKTEDDAIFDLIINRIGDSSEEEFTGEDIELAAGDDLYIDYGEWEGNGTQLELELYDDANDSTETLLIEDNE